MVTFNDLVASLASSDALPTLLDGPDVPPILHVTDVNARFVPPPFREEIPQTLGSTSVILLTAPAAVGKSTVAYEIARRTNAPLLDLSKFYVGDGFIEGTITKAYGRSQLAQILDSVENGTMALVFDALDEGEMRAGASNFEAFMVDLCALCRADRPKPSIVVLARGETALLAELYFQDRHINYASYVLDYFDEDGARQFLNLWLDDVNSRVRSADRAGHREYKMKFDEATNLLFNALSTAVASGSSDTSWDNMRVREFLGYAPVLAAIAEYLHVRNYYTICQALRDSPPWLGASQSAWHVLGSIVQSLIDREQGKIIDNIQPKLSVAAESFGFSTWVDLYGIDEQMTRVLARTLSIDVPDSLPMSMPGQLRDPYEDAVDIMLPQHPFLSDRGFTSVVFEEFLYARALQQGPEWLRVALRQRLRQPDRLPSPLLAYFMLESSVSEVSLIDAEDVGLLYNSLQSGARRPGEVQMAIGAGRTAEVEGWVWLAESPELSVHFEIGNPDKGISFWRRLSYCLINAPLTGLRLSSDQEFRFGPEAYIESRRLEINAREFRVDTGQTGDGLGTVLVAETFSDAGSVPRVRVYGRGEFLISWPNPVFPWIDYRADLDRPAEDDAVVAELYQHFRRILRGFRGSESRGGIGRSVHYIDAVAVGRSQLPNALLDHLIETGLLKRQSTRYVLDTDKAAALGLSFEDLRGSKIPDLTRPYLEGFASAYRET
jgi:hypothetical protein